MRGSRDREVVALRVASRQLIVEAQVLLSSLEGHQYDLENVLEELHRRMGPQGGMEGRPAT